MIDLLFGLTIAAYVSAVVCQVVGVPGGVVAQRIRLAFGLVYLSLGACWLALAAWGGVTS